MRDGLCNFSGCGRLRHARGWCVTHYGQYSRGEDLRPIRSRRAPTGVDLVIDHDHDCCPGRSCGECVRGVLCRTHNVWLGMVADDPAFMDRAARYLRRC